MLAPLKTWWTLVSKRRVKSTEKKKFQSVRVTSAQLWVWKTSLDPRVARALEPAPDRPDPFGHWAKWKVCVCVCVSCDQSKPPRTRTRAQCWSHGCPSVSQSQVRPKLNHNGRQVASTTTWTWTWPWSCSPLSLTFTHTRGQFNLRPEKRVPKGKKGKRTRKFTVFSKGEPAHAKHA